MLRHLDLSENIQASRFTTANGVDETWIVIRSRIGGDCETTFRRLDSDHQWALEKLGLENNRPVFIRIFLSDMEKQFPAISRLDFPERYANTPVSIVGQAPQNGGDMILFAYHLGGAGASHSPIHAAFVPGRAQAQRIDLENYSLIWGANFTQGGAKDTAEQTAGLFAAYLEKLQAAGTNLLASAVRTWIYIRNIDAEYSGMVAARKSFFTSQGLSGETRYIASTGIGAHLPQPEHSVSMDFLNILGLSPGQLVRMEAPGHLGPTLDYGVTFERGTLVRFGDREHLHISGTASINPAGEVLFPGDAHRQTLRALDNIQALLDPHGCVLNDAAYFIVYLRNAWEKEQIQSALEARIPADAPVIFVAGFVCRPSWLVEVECLVVKRAQHPFPPFA